MTGEIIKIQVNRRKESNSTRDMYQAIGRFIAYFSELEESLRWIVAAELKITSDPCKEHILNLIDYAALCHAAKRLLLLQEPTKRPADQVINDVIARCVAMGGQRNIIAHGAWDVRRGAKHINRQTLVAKFSFTRADDIEKLTEDLWSLIISVFEIYVMYNPPSTKKEDV